MFTNYISQTADASKKGSYTMNCMYNNFERYVKFFFRFSSQVRTWKKLKRCYTMQLVWQLILLRHKLHTKLQGVTYLAIIKSQRIFRALYSVTSLLQPVSQCLYTEWLLTVNLAPNVSTRGAYIIFNDDHCKLHGTYCFV